MSRAEPELGGRRAARPCAHSAKLRYRERMDRAVILNHLAQAERHVAEGEQHIIRQREIIEMLARQGHDTKAADELLGQFEQTLAAHIADRDRLRAELATS